MGSQTKTVTPGDLTLQLLNRLILKLDNGVTAGTDQVIVVFSHQLMFIAGLTVRQHHLTGQTGLHKQLQGTIDRGLADTGMGRLHLQVQLLNTQMLTGGKEDIQNNIALAVERKPCRAAKALTSFFFSRIMAPLHLIFIINNRSGTYGSRLSEKRFSVT